MVLDMFSLDGRIALVTGANDGIGQAIAIGLAEAGADIAGVFRTDISVTEEKVKALGRQFFGIKADLCLPDSSQKVFDAAMNHYGHIDILVNNAGTIRRADSTEYTEKDWDEVMNVNIRSLFFLTQKVGKQMIDKNIKGKIINTASLLSFQGGIRVPAYTASKSAVRGITMTLANEWAKYGICINSIAPGYIATKNTKALREDPERYEQILVRIPAGRWGMPDDIKGLAVFLASPASDYINGTTIPCDGGWMGR
ncbi:MAG: 2-dehydro-3-deoxy-D-gluconate 5-dehydrogenase KduD [Sphaerochaetaceae bacterium]|jgi:2-dehydro-3-deoxy-D-gluconate 5-dehydrogenase